MDWIIDERTREKILNFKKDYEQAFEKELKQLESISETARQYISQRNQWKDAEALLDWISILPSCIFRMNLFSRYHEVAGDKEIDFEALDTRCPKIEKEIRLKAETIRKDSMKGCKCRREMEKAAEKEFFGYLKDSGLWENEEAVHELRCLLPICTLQYKLDERSYELRHKKETAI